MSALDGIALLILLAMIAIVVVYVRQYRISFDAEFVPMTAWLRAGTFFCCCYLLSYATGTMERILTEPLVTAEQLSSRSWQLWMVGMVVFILVAYWGIWARFTIRFERELEFAPQVIYGLLWGTAFGQMFLAFWDISAMIGPNWDTWQIWLCTYIFLSFWQWFLMDMYWDIYISPEHDTAYSIALKTVSTHIPNVTLCLTFFALYENYLIFIALQTLALVGCSLNMRMPSPWCDKPTLPARQGPSFLFGLPRCAGYLSADPQNDPYLKAAHLPR